MDCDICKKTFENGDSAWTHERADVSVNESGVTVLDSVYDGNDWTFCEDCDANLDFDGSVKATLLKALKSITEDFYSHRLYKHFRERESELIKLIKEVEGK